MAPHEEENIAPANTLPSAERNMSIAEFPLFTVGPLYRLQEKFGLVREGKHRLGLIALCSLCIAWAPMALLAAAEGLAIGPTRLSSFLMDFAVNVRFLIALPVFLLSETMCERQLQTVIQQFESAGLVLEGARSQFQDVVRDIVQLSSSGRVAAVLLVIAYLHSLIAFTFFINYPEVTWRFGAGDGRHVLTLAGDWYFLVSFPIYSFMLLRWVWRLALWWRLLWRISGLELDLSPAHRDGAAGLGFLSESLLAFGGFAFAVTATTAGEVADYVVYEGASPLEYEWEVGGLLVALLIVIAGPLLLFVRQLYEAKDSAVFQYGALASRQIQQVDRKWLSEEHIQGGAGIDFGAVHQLGNSLTAVRDMSIIPLVKDDVLKLLFVAFLPYVPLLITLVPMDEVWKLLLKVVI